ncbi:hypothetical protein LBMAG42_26920 [Deltaproteobacteria bacterium]|nr:hypothetical protein LBMAG42_26920 [Deltaproteobacteria bacterium]
MLIVSLLAACSGGEDAQADDTAAAGTLVFANENNYTFAGELTIPSFPLAAGEDVGLDWSGLTRDLQCHETDPVGDIDNAALMVFPYLNQAEVAVGLAHDTLQQVDLGVYLSYEPGDTTSVSLSQLTFFGTEANIKSEFYPDGATWVVLLSTGTRVGVGTRTLTFIEPDSGVSERSADIADACEVLDYTVDLEAMSPLPVPAQGPWTVDWTGLTVNGHGGPFDPNKVTEVTVAHFTTSALEDLEADFLDLETLADRVWRVEHRSGTTAALADLRADDDGTAFTGFEPGGTWVLAILCATCSIPAPLGLAVLVPT